MSREHDKLIDDLVADLRPVRRPGRIGASLVAWLLLAGGYSLLMTLATGPLRPGALRALLDHPLFAAESAIAMLAVFALARASLRSAIPAGREAAHRLWWSLLPLAAWVAIYVVGFRHPAHPVSTLGDREVCIWQVLLFSLPTLGLMQWCARRQYPLWPRLTGALAGAASAAIPGALMQFACMYEPAHILLYHLAPMVPAAILGALLGPLTLRVRNVVPRHRAVSLH